VLKTLLSLIFASFLLPACSQEQSPQRDVGPSEFQKELQTRLINAQAGDVIEIPEGFYELRRGLSLNVSGVTILSFKHQVQGAEGLLVIASDFTIEDLAIEDTPGDGLKVNEGRNIIIRRYPVLQLSVTCRFRNCDAGVGS
jgi:hypothetical protein